MDGIDGNGLVFDSAAGVRLKFGERDSHLTEPSSTRLDSNHQPLPYQAAYHLYCQLLNRARNAA